MSESMSGPIIVDSISQIHKGLGLPNPKHPLVTKICNRDIQIYQAFRDVRVVVNLYQISLKKGTCGKLKYGRSSYDYQEGTLMFTAPGQVMEHEGDLEINEDYLEGWTLVFHPDLLRKSGLANTIDDYSFFRYESNEALHISDDERKTIEELLGKVVEEYSQNLDKHSQHLIISNIQLLLDYCLRFYDRQFYTRTNLNSDVISKFERLLKAYYSTSKVSDLGVPSVNYCARELSLSNNYLSDLLKKETGKSAQEHIHLHIIEKAKNQLLNSRNTVSEIAYGLGFEYPQHFSNLFKSKTGQSPREYRSLN